MADTVGTRVISGGPRTYAVRLTNVSDGTGEAAVIKVDLSTLATANGLAPTNTTVQEIQWSIQGFSSVSLLWDHTTDDLIDVLATGNGYRDYVWIGGLADPLSAGGTGDILLTTTGAVAGASYDITLVVLLGR